MDERICSLETEYALVSNLITNALLTRENLAGQIEKTLCTQHAWVRCNSINPQRQANQVSTRHSGLVQPLEGQFIENGSRVYLDVEHLEWANPETLSPLSALLYEKAAERNLIEAVQEVQNQQRAKYPDSWIMLVKNNIDYTETTSYGCHENYSLRRFDQQGRDVFDRLIDDLIPFLVTRQIICGAGRIGTRTTLPDDPYAFQLSPRADFIEQTMSRNPREERGILNLRDEPLADEHQWRRLHLIAGDSNMSDMANYLKIGVTAIVLSLLENNQIIGRWALKEPVSALRQVSRDWRHARLALRGGEYTDALTIQRSYWQMAARMVDDFPLNHFSHQIIALWRETLDDLENDSPQLARRFDWAIKQHWLFNGLLRSIDADWQELGYWYYVVQCTQHLPLPPQSQSAAEWLKHQLPFTHFHKLNHYVKNNRLEWSLYPSRRQLFDRLREADFRYHDIMPQTGLYAFLAQRSKHIDRLLENEEEILYAQRHPPQNTRAWQRGELITLSNKKGLKMEMNWDRVRLLDSDRVLLMRDPFNPKPISSELLPESASSKPPSRSISSPQKVQIKIVNIEQLKD